MSAILSATGPIFLIIGIGYVLVRYNILPKDGVKALGTLVLMVALPAVIFKALSHRPFVEILNPSFLLAFGIGSLGTALITFGIARFLLKRPMTYAAIMAMGASSANSGFVGYPIAALVVGPPAVVALALCMLIENFLVIPLLLAIAEAGNDPDRKPGAAIAAALKALLVNPLIIAIAFGATFSIFELKLPGILATSVDMLAAASAPVALIVIGGALANLPRARNLDGLALVVAGKLLLHPIAVAGALFAVATFMPAVSTDLRRALLIIAAAPMMTIYPLIGARFGQGAQAAASLLAATVLSFVTLTLVIAITAP